WDLSLTSPAGFTASGIAAGLWSSGRPGVGLLVSETPAVSTGVFTSTRVVAAPVVYTKRNLRNGIARANVVNAGNATACTGRQGAADAKATARDTAKTLGVAPGQVLVASTGVI